MIVLKKRKYWLSPINRLVIYKSSCTSKRAAAIEITSSAVGGLVVGHFLKHYNQCGSLSIVNNIFISSMLIGNILLAVLQSQLAWSSRNETETPFLINTTWNAKQMFSIRFNQNSISSPYWLQYYITNIHQRFLLLRMTSLHLHWLYLPFSDINYNLSEQETLHVCFLDI